MKGFFAALLCTVLASTFAVVAAPLAQAQTTTPGTNPTTGLPPSTLGMRPNGGFLRIGEFNKWERTLDSDINWYVGFADRNSPEAMRSSVYGQLRARDAALPGLSNRLNLVMTVPLAFGRQTAKTEEGRQIIRRKLEETAAGTWDVHYRILAENLVAGGYPDAVIRLGHEFTGGWYPWSAQGNAESYIAAYRHIHRVLRGVSPRFRFEWNAAIKTFIEHGPQAYPGDSFVDIVGLDLYYRPSRDGSTLQEGSWDRIFIGPLEAHRAFAAARNKPIAYSEWAVGGVDEPEFIQRMYDWMRSLPRSGPGSLLYHAYFNATKAEYNLDGYPRQRQRYIDLFGGAGRTAASAPAPTPGTSGTRRVSVRPARAVEGSKLVFRISLNEPMNTDLTVQVRTEPITASAGSDFRARAGQVVIPAGRRRGYFGVPTHRDRITEPNETLRLRVLSTDSAAVTSLSSGQGTIIDR